MAMTICMAYLMVKGTTCKLIYHIEARLVKDRVRNSAVLVCHLAATQFRFNRLGRLSARFLRQLALLLRQKARLKKLDFK